LAVSSTAAEMEPLSPSRQELWPVQVESAPVPLLLAEPNDESHITDSAPQQQQQPGDEKAEGGEKRAESASTSDGNEESKDNVGERLLTLEEEQQQQHPQPIGTIASNDGNTMTMQNKKRSRDLQPQEENEDQMRKSKRRSAPHKPAAISTPEVEIKTMPASSAEEGGGVSRPAEATQEEKRDKGKRLASEGADQSLAPAQQEQRARRPREHQHLCNPPPPFSCLCLSLSSFSDRSKLENTKTTPPKTLGGAWSGCASTQ